MLSGKGLENFIKSMLEHKDDDPLCPDCEVPMREIEAEEGKRGWICDQCRVITIITKRSE